MAFFGTIDVAGKIIYTDNIGLNPESGQWEPTRRDWQIRAVVEDFRREVYDRDYANVFVLSPGARARANIIVRLRDGIDARRFVQEQERNVQHNIVTEHNYIRKMQTAREASELDLNSSWMGKQTRRNLLIAAFFAINLALGVFGTLLMYTRQRREEAGSSGASSARRGCSPPSALSPAAPSTSSMPPPMVSPAILGALIPPSTSGSMTSAPTSSWSLPSSTLLYYAPCSSPPPSPRCASAGAKLPKH